MKKITLFLIMFFAITFANAQIQDDITFNYTKIKADTIISYPMLSNFQWSLNLIWNDLTNAPDSLYEQQAVFTDSIEVYETTLAEYLALQTINCGDTGLYDSLSTVYATTEITYLNLDTTLNDLKDSADLVQIYYFNRDTLLKNKLDSVPIIIASYEALVLDYTALRDTAYLTDTATALLYQDTLDYYDSLSGTKKALTLLYKDSIDVNKINYLSTANYIIGIERLITSNELDIVALNITDSLNTIQLNLYDSLCTSYTDLYNETDSIITVYTAYSDSVQTLINTADSINSGSLQFSIYMSNDGINWNLYNALYDVTVTDASGNIMFEDVNFTGKYLGLRIEAVNTTRGTLKGIILTKYNFKR